MKNKYLHKIFIAISYAVCSLNISALDINKHEVLLAPKCFIENNSIDYQELAYSKKKNQVLLSVDRNYFWQKLSTIKHSKKCGKFLNVTDEWQQYANNKSLEFARISVLDYEIFLDNLFAENNLAKNNSKKFNVNLSKAKSTYKLLNNFYDRIDSERINNSLKELSEHYNRAAYTNEGLETATHINDWMKKIEKDNKSGLNFEVSYVNTNSIYKQPSVVAVLGKDLPGDGLVISAHMDTNGGGRRPGADDDGSGAMVVLETARILTASEIKLTRPVYFIWYAAEEMGLIGSKKVVNSFRSNNIKIDSVLHFDTIGHRANANDPTLFLLKDNVSSDFTDYLSTLLKNFVNVPVDYTMCGYSCSDHAIWNYNGYVAAAGFESSFDDINPYLHTTDDKIEHVTIDNLINFTKLALTYVTDRAVK